MKIHAFGLLYGDYPELHARTIGQLHRPGFQTTVWCNQVCDQTISELIRRRITTIWTDNNRPKFQAMREMFSLVPDEDINPENWILWLDDDNKYVGPWLERALWMMDFYKSRNPVCMGSYKLKDWTPESLDVLYEAKWYTGRELPKMGVPYVMGGYTWLRADIIKKLDYPDKFLVHNNTDTPGGVDGDACLGMALYQNNYEVLNCSEGVIVNAHQRRGIGAAVSSTL